MNPRVAAIGLMVLLSARCAASQETPGAGEGPPESGSAGSTGQTAALDAAWSTVESKNSPESGKTIRRRGAAAKSDTATAGRKQPATSGSWTRSIASLGAVVAVILFLAWGAKSLTRGGPLAARAKRPGVIEIVSRTALSQRQSLCLVRVGSRMVLLGVTQESVRTLDVIHDPDAVAALAGEAIAAKSAESEAAFRASLERETVNYETPAKALSASPVRSGVGDMRQRLNEALERVKGAAKQT